MCLFLFLFSCNNKESMKLQVHDDVVVEKHKDTIIIKSDDYPDTLVMGNDSMYYNMNGVLTLSTQKDTVTYHETGLSTSYGFTVIRQEGKDRFRSSWYLYLANKKSVLRTQILYNRNFEILGMKFVQPIEYKK